MTGGDGTPVLDTDREGFRRWLQQNHADRDCCWVICSRGRPVEGKLAYIDAVEEALCFGWIDSTTGNIDGRFCNRFGPRRKGSHWTELNKARVRRLERLGLMTDAGRAVLPDMDEVPPTDANMARWFRQHPDMEQRFMSYPELYRNIQMSNLEFCRTYRPKEYRKKLKLFRERLEKDMITPGWDDYGRLPRGPLAGGPRQWDYLLWRIAGTDA